MINISIYDNVLIKKLINILILTLPNLILFSTLEAIEFKSFLILVSLILIICEFLCFGGSLENSKTIEKIKEARKNRNGLGILIFFAICFYFFINDYPQIYYLLSFTPFLMANSISVYEHKNKYKNIYTNELIISVVFLIIKIFYLRDINSYIFILFFETFTKHINIERSINFDLKRYQIEFKIRNNHLLTGIALVFLSILTRVNILFLDEASDTINAILFLTSTSFGLVYNYSLVNSSLDWENNTNSITKKLTLFAIFYGIGGYLIISLLNNMFMDVEIILTTIFIVFVQILISNLICKVNIKQMILIIMVLLIQAFFTYQFTSIKIGINSLITVTTLWLIWIVIYRKLIY